MGCCLAAEAESCASGTRQAARQFIKPEGEEERVIYGGMSQLRASWRKQGGSGTDTLEMHPLCREEEQFLSFCQVLPSLPPVIHSLHPLCWAESLPENSHGMVGCGGGRRSCDSGTVLENHLQPELRFHLLPAKHARGWPVLAWALSRETAGAAGLGLGIRGLMVFLNRIGSEPVPQPGTKGCHQTQVLQVINDLLAHAAGIGRLALGNCSSWGPLRLCVGLRFFFGSCSMAVVLWGGKASLYA